MTPEELLQRDGIYLVLPAKLCVPQPACAEFPNGYWKIVDENDSRVHGRIPAELVLKVVRQEFITRSGV